MHCRARVVPRSLTLIVNRYRTIFPVHRIDDLNGASCIVSCFVGFVNSIAYVRNNREITSHNSHGVQVVPHLQSALFVLIQS